MTEESIPRPPLAWGLLLIPALAQIVLHVFTTGNYGIFRDEYYYLACASRLDWGYVDQPGLSIWILAGWTAAFGDSIHSLRALPALCGAGLVFLTGSIAAEMGGRRWAQFLAGLGSAIGGAGLILCGFYSMNAFDVLFWAGAYLVVARIARTGDGRHWPWLGLVLGLGLLNKIGLLVFCAALVLGLLLTRYRRHLLEGGLWFSGAFALLCLLPYALWNMVYDWPTMEFIQNAREHKIVGMPLPEYLKEAVLQANPGALILWLPGLIWLLVARAGRLRVAGLVFLITAGILVLQNSKPYYLMASYAVLMAAGGVAWEAWTERRGLRWVRGLMALNLIAGGAIMAPIAVPLLTPEKLAAYQERLGITTTPQEVGHGSVLPQHFSDRFGWEELARTVEEVYSGLPERERDGCVVVTSNYGHAGSLEYWSRKYTLPPVFSGHNNYYLWGPPPELGVVLAIGYSREGLESVFDQVSEGGERIAPDAIESRLTVWVCRGLRISAEELWEEVKHFI